MGTITMRAAMMEVRTAVELIEESAIPDVFISGIAKIERLSGGNVRITYYAERRDVQGAMEHVAVLKVIRSAETWPQAINMVSRLLGHNDVAVVSDGQPQLDS